MSKAERIRALTQLLDSPRPKSRLETLAIERQIRDLRSASERGLVWDEAESERAVKFFGLLTHWKGEWAGKPIILQPWQAEVVIRPLFGWRRTDGSRRFRTGYVEIPRKNGKSTIGAGVGLYALTADREPGAEVYSAATKRDQAKILFEDAKKLVRKSRSLRSVLELYQHSIACPRLDGRFAPLSSDDKSMDGLNVHCAIVDELHAHRDRGVWDVLQTAMGARRQPLQLAITTAGFDRHSVCWELHEYARKVLESAADPAAHDDFLDDSFFAFVAAADEDDEWTDPTTWAKANPNLDVAVKQDYLEGLVKQALESPAAEANFRRKHLNQWVSRDVRAINREAWRECRDENVSAESLAGRPCWIGVDLGFRDDFAAVTLVFPEFGEPDPDEDDAERDEFASNLLVRATWFPTFWLPTDGVRNLEKPPFVNWVARKQINLTDGNATDVRAIFRHIVAAAERYDVRKVALDPANARQLGQDLMAHGIEIEEFWQSKRNYNEPCRELGTLLADRAFAHPGHPVLDWMAENVVYEQDAAGLVMPAKHKSAEKIDGIVAGLMGLGAAMFDERPGDAGLQFFEE